MISESEMLEGLDNWKKFVPRFIRLMENVLERNSFSSNDSRRLREIFTDITMTKIFLTAYNSPNKKKVLEQYYFISKTNNLLKDYTFGNNALFGNGSDHRILILLLNKLESSFYGD
ncbi:hypothetical protein J4476_06220 [Candidatus Woesearchaeota archaeon]|nr:MAG: hypothetical protein QT09_C0014G0024 [archaeon GW2011_AR18]MBS3162264.1 hypothetical protein [Candidatus Woesearchaeota archaeon]HIH25173.1 hypothetical protein [Nanoarchaeota archaeon]